METWEGEVKLTNNVADQIGISMETRSWKEYIMDSLVTDVTPKGGEEEDLLWFLLQA